MKLLQKVTLLVLIISTCLLSNVLAQDFSGRFTGEDEGGNQKVLDLEFNGSGYSGILGFGVEFAYVEAEIEDGVLIGIYSLGEKADGYVTAIREDDFLLVYVAPLKEDGSMDEDRMVELFLEKESATTNPVTDPPATSPVTSPINPLAPAQETIELIGQDIQFGVPYGGGTSLKSDLAGLSFSIPNNGQASYSPEQGFIIAHAGLLVGGVQLIVLSSGNFQALISDLITIEDEETFLVPLTEVEQSENRFKGQFQLMTETDVLYKEVRAQQTSTGQIVVLVVSALPQDAEQITIFAEEIEQSLRFATPNLSSIASLNTSLAGINFSRGTGGSLGGGAISGYSMSLDLCSSREFRLYEDSVFSLGVNDPVGGELIGGARSESEETSFGVWELGAGLAGPTILLQKQDGGFDYLEMLELQGGMFLNAKPVQASQSQICQ